VYRATLTLCELAILCSHRNIRIGRCTWFVNPSPSTIAQDVSSDRLERYFVREDGSYRVIGELREICLFSVHNLLRDPPFSKLDLLSCRNLLIYLTAGLQDRLIPLFHYALHGSGYLFLGPSENVTKHSKLFAVIDKPHRIFQRRGLPDRPLPDFPLAVQGDNLRTLGETSQIPLRQDSLQNLAERQLLDHYTPAHVVINEDGEVLLTSGRTGKYLELAPGVPKTDIFSMSRGILSAEVRALLHKAVNSGLTVVQNNIVIGTHGGWQVINLIIQPIHAKGARERVYLLIFQDVGGMKSTSDEEAEQATEDGENANLQQLDAELRATKERLQTMTEELESSNEELRSGNEELSSMNEELQSANEELETSKEELQSI
jgi:two-component system, chemotaxis family, CheB/CheR fusion protein